MLIIDVDGCLYRNDRIHDASQETGLIAREFTATARRNSVFPPPRAMHCIINMVTRW